MLLLPSFRNAVLPILSRISEQVDRELPIENPEIGLRWGKPSNFDFSAQERGNNLSGISVELRDTPNNRKYARIYETTLGLEVFDAFVRAENNPDSNYVRVRQVHRIQFNYTETLDQLPWGSYNTRTTIFDLRFNLHPPNEGS